MDLKPRKGAEKPAEINLKETFHREMQAANYSLEKKKRKRKRVAEQFPPESVLPSYGMGPGYKILRFIPLLPLVGI